MNENHVRRNKIKQHGVKQGKPVNTVLLALFLSGLLSACNVFDGDSDDDDDVGQEQEQEQQPQTNSFSVTVSNHTHNQPLSPIAVIIHDGGYSAWQFGGSASEGLEMLAEGGDNALLLQEADAVSMTVSGSGDSAFGPGEASTVELEVDTAFSELSLVTMLVNTNDAFTGLNGVDLSGLAVGESLSRKLAVYDAGTEANSEAVGSIPGPADGGEGFNALRDDLDKVARHPGIASIDGNNPDSALDQSHRFDAPVATLTVTRTE